MPKRLGLAIREKLSSNATYLLTLLRQVAEIISLGVLEVYQVCVRICLKIFTRT